MKTIETHQKNSNNKHKIIEIRTNRIDSEFWKSVYDLSQVIIYPKYLSLDDF